MKSNIVICTSKDGIIKVDTSIENENIWMNQEQLAKLYDTTKNNISIHMKNIFECGKLEESLVVKKFLTTASDNKKYKVMHYNLDAIIAVGIVLIQKGQQNLECGLLKY